MTSALDRAIARARAVLDGDCAYVEKTIWGSPAGKKRIADRLAKLLPPHKTYVEPFAGSAAVLFVKAVASSEIINDADADITKAYRLIKRLSEKDVARLESMKWTGDEATFKRLMGDSPKDDVVWLHKFLYTTHFSYGKLRRNSFSPAAVGVEARCVDRIRQYAPRLAKVKVFSGDYEAVVRKFDGKDTAFYFDPPYAGYNVDIGESKFDESRFFKLLKSLKGKFLLTYGLRGELPKLLKEEGYEVRRIRTRRTINGMRGVGGPGILTQLLVSNYELSKKCLSDVDAVHIELAQWSRAYINDLPDSAFLYIEPGGKKDDQGATVPRELRHFPVRDADGMLDLPHLQNAIARIPQAKIPSLTMDDLTALQDKARKLLEQPQGKFSKSTQLIKGIDPNDERFVLGVVLQPEVVDAQGDIYSAVEIRHAAHRFMEDFGALGLMHRYRVNDQVKVVETYLAPTDLTIGDQPVPKGTWLLGVHVLSDELWGQVKDGVLTGFSIGGSAKTTGAGPANAEATSE